MIGLKCAFEAAGVTVLMGSSFPAVAGGSRPLASDMGLEYHNGMKVPYEKFGRTTQKNRTRTALIEATRKLLSTGRFPTVEEAAEAAAISRTTAYRYFPDQ